MTSEPSAARPDPPPLRIHHFLVWMAVSAAWLAYWKSGGGGSASPLFVFFAIHFTIYAAGLTAAGFSIYWWWKGYAAFVQPGQWLLLWYLLVVLSSVSRLLLAYLSSGVAWRSPWQEDLLLWEPGEFARLVRFAGIAIHILLSFGLPMLLYGGAWRIADTRAWRVFFLLLLADRLLSFCIYLGSDLFGFFTLQGTSMVWPYALLEIAVNLMCLWPMAADILVKRSRLWTHWLGAGLMVTSQLAVLLISILAWLLKW